MASSSSIVEASAKKTIVLISKEKQNFEVNEAAAMLSNTVKNMIEDGCTEGGIPLPNVDSATLAKVLEYCNAHAAAAAADGDLNKFDSDYKKSLEDDRVQNMLFDVILGKTPEQIRTKFHIINDYTPEEEAAVRRENQWAFE
ncbi:hypothetical protein SASPL_154916 [Salvia splendens]|uniref:SKP1-like protein n=1 Tax=Salvia splendens TaxID=180675 RepID=A0A8X8W0X1_SALSN|nr:hypothetical protein SASPL_154916 [Salvia splendens]